MNLIEPNRQWGISRGFGDGHDGIDYKYPENTPVTAAADGIVGFEGYGQNDPWTLAMGGIYVRIQHSDGSWTGYAHLSKTTVNKGQKVKAGQVIGYSGHTGQATGPHLHFEVIPAIQDWKNGYSARVDPTPFFSSPDTTAPAKGGDMADKVDLDTARRLAYAILGDKTALTGKRDADLKKNHVGHDLDAAYIAGLFNSKEAQIARLAAADKVAPAQASDADKKLAALKQAAQTIHDTLGIK